MRSKAGDIYLNYEITGSGFPLALIHGLGGSLENWADVVPSLARRCRVLTWDVRGFGRSDKPEGEYTIGLFARDLSHLLQALNIPQSYILGISMGGVVAQRFALDYPQMTRALVLVSTSSQVGEKATQAWLAQAEAVEREGMAAVANRSDPNRSGYSPAFMAQHADKIAEAQRRTLANDPKAYARAARAVSSYNYTPELARVSCPTLILQGEADTLTPPGGSVIIHRNIPGSRLVMIKDCGHAMTTEKPEVFAELVLEFLKGVDQGHPLPSGLFHYP